MCYSVPQSPRNASKTGGAQHRDTDSPQDIVLQWCAVILSSPTLWAAGLLRAQCGPQNEYAEIS